MGSAAAPSGRPPAGCRLVDRGGPGPRSRPGARRPRLRPRRRRRPTRRRCVGSFTSPPPISSPPGWCSNGSCPACSPSSAAAAAPPCSRSTSWSVRPGSASPRSTRPAHLAASPRPSLLTPTTVPSGRRAGVRALGRYRPRSTPTGLRPYTRPRTRPTSWTSCSCSPPGPGSPADDLDLLRRLLSARHAADVAAEFGVTARTVRNRRAAVTGRLRELALAA